MITDGSGSFDKDFPCPFDPRETPESAGTFACPVCGCTVDAGKEHPLCAGCRRSEPCPDCGHLIYYHSRGVCWHDDNCACANAPSSGLLPWDVDGTWTGL